MVGLVAVLAWNARWETLASHICCVEGGVQYVPGLGVPLIVAAKHHVIGEPALDTMALLHTTWLYYILPLFQFNLLYSTMTLLGST